MRTTLTVALAALFTAGLASPALAEDDDEKGWFEPGEGDEPEEVEEVTVEEAPPPAKKKKKKRKKRVEVEVETIESDTPPAWTRGRRGMPRKVIPAEEGVAPPPGYTLQYKNRKNLWIPGVVLLTTGYAASALTSASGLLAEGECWGNDCSGGDDWGWGFVPVVGPWVIAADEDFEGGWRFAYGVFGVAQALGLGLTIGGAATKRPVWVLKPEHRAGAPSIPEVTIGAGHVTLKTTF